MGKIKKSDAGVPGADPRVPPVGSVIIKVYKRVEYRVRVEADGFDLISIGGVPMPGGAPMPATYSTLREVMRTITGRDDAYPMRFFGLTGESATHHQAPATRYAEAVSALRSIPHHLVATSCDKARGHSGTKETVNLLRKLANDLERGWKGAI